KEIRNSGRFLASEDRHLRANSPAEPQIHYHRGSADCKSSARLTSALEMRGRSRQPGRRRWRPSSLTSLGAAVCYISCCYAPLSASNPPPVGLIPFLSSGGASA